MKFLSFRLKFADTSLKWGLDLLTCNDLKMFLKQKMSVSQNIDVLDGIVYIQSMTLFLTIFQGSLMAKCH